MSEKQKIAARKRWDNTTPEELARLGGLHSEIMKKYHANRTPEERAALGALAARARWERAGRD